jgi:VWFA-related protein
VRVPRPLALAFVLGAVLSERPYAQEAPKKLGLEEKVQRRLAQLDVSMTGPPELISGLTVEQFHLWVAAKRTPIVAIDSFCGAHEQVDRPAEKEESKPQVTPRAPIATYLFYFDHQNTTYAGRANSIEQARKLIPMLIHDGNRGALVANGRKTVTYAATTDRTDELLAGLSRLEADVGIWDNYPELEQSRQEDVMRTYRSSGQEAACMQARMYLRDELARAEHALAMFSMVLGRFADVEGPKAAVYFADTLRDQPGRHFVSIVNPPGSVSLVRGRMECTVPAAESYLSFQKLHDRAATYGVKVYSIQAEGLVPPAVSGVRVAREDALRGGQGGLKTLGLETGGNAFLNGAAPEFIAKSIETDHACVYVLSFDPAGFPEDKPLPVRVDLDVPKVKVRTRTEIVIQSDEARRMSTLLAAFAAPDTVRDAVPMRGAIVPLGVEDGKLRVLLQASLPETKMPSGELWDIGMSVVSGPKIKTEASGRVGVSKPGIRIVLEAEAMLSPAPYDVALVATEGATGQIAIGRISGSWDGKLANGVALPAILQPVEGAFLRDGKARTKGSLAVVEDEPVRADRPAAFVTLVCRTEKRQEAVTVHRALSGPSTTTLSPQSMPFADAACVQVRDVIPAGTLVPGDYSYEIGVEGKDGTISRSFSVKP